MARTPSTMTDLGRKAPDFLLADTVSGNKISLEDFKGGVATVIMFICNHCPFVLHVNEELVKLANDHSSNNISFVAISANDVITHPDDSPEKMKATALQMHYPFPYLYDETQDVARAFDAACTPDFFIYNKDLELVYRGQLDDSRPGNGIPVTGKDIRHALACLLNNEPVPQEQRPSIGCNIKWKQ
ncbi:MAG TPA: thioredoxin family protein [Ferruginibacter sp.]|jgi:peroxiredoxin|nr:thioredoxin family protein [Ferruginibacter sp.]